MTRLWRCVHERHAADAFGGKGGILVSGRWHSKNVPICYTSTSPGTAILEALVHAGDLRELTRKYVLIGATIDGDCIREAEGIPDNWSQVPFSPETKAYGDAWLDSGASLGLRVPSSVVPDDNVLLNPLHAQWADLEIDVEHTAWDPRLAKM